MRKLFLFLFISIVAIGLFITNAEAARFGGGKSFGMSRSFHSNGVFSSGSATRPLQSAAPASSGASKWLGPLAGFAAGGLLASLFMGHGLGSGLLSWLLIGGLAFFAWRLFSSRIQSANQPSPLQYQSAQNTPYSSSTPESVAIHPAGFDEAAFLRQAKTTFIRLQADYDSKNSHDIRGFTTPEVFAEIQLQLQERGDTQNQTEVVSINATLQDIAVESQTTIASVLFSGLIREQPTSEPVTINEIWHFVKNGNAENWLVSGVQQG